jgi:Flp pilus assembly protein CpaB
MRASTVFALTIAILIGLGAVVGARYAGYLGKAEPAKKEVQVLVAGRNIFPGDVIEAAWVKARALRPEELAHYEANKQQYLPPVPTAAALRVPKRGIEADSPILREDLQEMVKPEPLHARLLPNMRAVNISVPKDQSAGGLIQVGEWVDVYMTTTISAEGGAETTRTAPIANKVRVIAKRNALWNVFAALPENKPVHFTLEMNPYRAGLVEFARTKGTISLVPLSAAEQKTLEEKRAGLIENKNGGAAIFPVAFAENTARDYDREEVRVEALNKGEYAIGTSDLVRIFDLSTTAPPRPDVRVENFAGLKRNKTMNFGSDGMFVSTEDPKARASGKKAANGPSFQFTAPDCAGAGKKGCSTCGKNKGT